MEGLGYRLKPVATTSFYWHYKVTNIKTGIATKVKGVAANSNAAKWSEAEHGGTQQSGVRQNIKRSKAEWGRTSNTAKRSETDPLKGPSAAVFIPLRGYLSKAWCNLSFWVSSLRCLKLSFSLFSLMVVGQKMYILLENRGTICPPQKQYRVLFVPLFV